MSTWYFLFTLSYLIIPFYPPWVKETHIKKWRYSHPCAHRDVSRLYMFCQYLAMVATEITVEISRRVDIPVQRNLVFWHNHLFRLEGASNRRVWSQISTGISELEPWRHCLKWKCEKEKIVVLWSFKWSVDILVSYTLLLTRGTLNRSLCMFLC
jgi:hypothetical protein